MIDSNCIVTFDIETIPDEQHHQGDTFPKVLFHRVVAISYLRANIIGGETADTNYEVEALRSGGEVGFTEEQLVKGFFAFVEKSRPRLVTFNGRGFDLPVLKYRAMKHGVSAPWLSQGQGRWENYGQRYAVHWHTDLMDALSEFGASKVASLDEICTLLGIPSKLGMRGSEVAQAIQDGQIVDVRNYCETDVLSTYLVFLRYALLRGEIGYAGYQQSVASVEAFLRAPECREHLKQYLAAWKGN